MICHLARAKEVGNLGGDIVIFTGLESIFEHGKGAVNKSESVPQCVECLCRGPDMLHIGSLLGCTLDGTGSNVG